MKEKNTFSKADIIKLIEDDPSLQYSFKEYRSTEKRLNTILQFLQKEETIKAFKQGHQTDYWLEKEMTLFTSSLTKHKYEYNKLDAVFLIVLEACYEDLYFKNLRENKNIKNPREESQNFIESFSAKFEKWKALLIGEHKFGANEFEDEDKKEIKENKSTEEMKKEIEKSGFTDENKEKEYQIRIIKENFIFILNQLSISTLAMKYTKEIENKVNSLMILFFSLQDGNKIEVYEKFMKNRVNTIAKEMDKFTDDLKENDPESYFELKENINLDYEPILNEDIKNALNKLYQN